MTRITRSEARKLIDATDGKIFRAVFLKRTTDEDGKRHFRKMVARKGVTKGVTGKGMAYDPKASGLITVFDMQKAAFRHISVEGLVSVRVNHENYRVVADPTE